MPLFEYSCSSGNRFTLFRSVAERNDPASCAAGGQAWRVFSVPTIHWGPGVHPVTGTSWHDLYDESPRELAQRKDIERYDPSLSHKPEIPPVDVRKFLPERGESSGSAERLRLQPIPGEHLP